MYSWDDDTSGWLGKGRYHYDSKGAERRARAARRAAARGPRTYDRKSGPNEKVIDSRKHIESASTNPLIVAVDVTGSSPPSPTASISSSSWARSTGRAAAATPPRATASWPTG